MEREKRQQNRHFSETNFLSFKYILFFLLATSSNF